MVQRGSLHVTVERLLCTAGTPEPLGPSPTTAPAGVNFALFSQHAAAVSLVLLGAENKATREIALDGIHHRTGDVWHCTIEGLPHSNILYGFKVIGEGGWETGHRCAIIS